MKRMNVFLEAAVHDMGLPPDSLPRMSHEEVLASRERLQAGAPRPAGPPPQVPARFKDARFASMVARSQVKGLQAAVKAVHKWVDAVAGGDNLMIALVGPHGVGKSHLLACAAWELWEAHGIFTPWLSWYMLVDWLRYGRTIVTEHGHREQPASQVRESWYAMRHCIVDEARPTSGTEFDSIEMAKFSIQRYDNDKGVLLSCNWSSLGNFIGEQPADRYEIITLDGPSYR